MSMTPDKPGWWRLRLLWDHYDNTEHVSGREFIVEVERHEGELCYWLPQLDYTEPVAQCKGEWLGPAILFDNAQWAELRRLRDEAREGMDRHAIYGPKFAELHTAATAYETCARLLGRELPEWKPTQEKGSK